MEERRAILDKADSATGASVPGAAEPPGQRRPKKSGAGNGDAGPGQDAVDSMGEQRWQWMFGPSQGEGYGAVRQDEGAGVGEETRGDAEAEATRRERQDHWNPV